MRRTLVGVLTSLVVAVIVPATATADDGVVFPIDPGPVPVPALCATGVELEPPVPGELPVLEDPVYGTSEGVSCPTGIESTDAFANADVEVVVATEETQWEFRTVGGLQTGQIRIRAEVLPAGIGDATLGTTIQYKVTVTAGNAAPRIETVVVQAILGQGGGTYVGGHNTSNFNPPIPAGAKVKVELVTGTGQVRIGTTNKPFTIKPADQGEKVRP